jgi:hypothetical protein
VTDEPERLPPPPFWRTRYFADQVMAKRSRTILDPIVIQRILNTPERKVRQEDGRIRFWGWVPETLQWVRVVTLADGETVHNVMPDRDFEP